MGWRNPVNLDFFFIWNMPGRLFRCSQTLIKIKGWCQSRTPDESMNWLKGRFEESKPRIIWVANATTIRALPLVNQPRFIDPVLIFPVFLSRSGLNQYLKWNGLYLISWLVLKFDGVQLFNLKRSMFNESYRQTMTMTHVEWILKWTYCGWVRVLHHSVDDGRW